MNKQASCLEFNIILRQQTVDRLCLGCTSLLRFCIVKTSISVKYDGYNLESQLLERLRGSPQPGSNIAKTHFCFFFF